MALTKEDLQAISELMDVKLHPINSRFDRIESDISELKAGQAEIRGELTEVKGDMVEVKEELTEVKEELIEVKKDVAKVKGDMVEVKEDVTKVKGDMVEVKRKVSYTYQLALDAWGTSTENRTWLEKNRFPM